MKRSERQAQTKELGSPKCNSECCLQCQRPPESSQSGNPPYTITSLAANFEEHMMWRQECNSIVRERKGHQQHTKGIESLGGNYKCLLYLGLTIHQSISRNTIFSHLSFSQTFVGTQDAELRVWQDDTAKKRNGYREHTKGLISPKCNNKSGLGCQRQPN